MNKTIFNNRIECNSFLQMLYNINGKDRVKVCSFTEHTNGTIELCYSILPKVQAGFVKFMDSMASIDSNYNPYN